MNGIAKGAAGVALTICGALACAISLFALYMSQSYINRNDPNTQNAGLVMFFVIGVPGAYCVYRGIRMAQASGGEPPESE
jgi:hypothetical protein